MAYLVRLWVITQAFCYIHKIGDRDLPSRKFVFLSNKEIFVVSHGPSIVLRQMSLW